MPETKGTTRYAALAALLKKRIYAGEWAPGVTLPAEMELARHYKVALGTIRQAIDVLVSEKLLVKRHGRGTLVSNGLTGNTTLRFFRFNSGVTPENQPVSRIVRQEIVVPETGHIALFGNDCQRVLKLERLRTFDGVARVHEEVWLPLPLFNAMTDLSVAQWEDRLYPLYAKHAGVTIVNASDHLSVEPMPESISSQLGFQAAHCGLVIKRTSVDILGRTVEYRVATGDAFEFVFSDEAG
jgi:GntR family transcriptional regulator